MTIRVLRSAFRADPASVWRMAQERGAVQIVDDETGEVRGTICVPRHQPTDEEVELERANARIAELEKALEEACDVLESAWNILSGEDICDDPDEAVEERERITRLRAVLKGDQQ